MRTLIVGGVAGGMSAATRLRRLDPHADIVVLERSGHVSYANCGLPYYAGGTITDRDALLLQTPASLAARFRLDVRVGQDVQHIDRDAQFVKVHDMANGLVYTETYDALVLATGAVPIIPPLPGIERAVTLQTVEDVDRLVGELGQGPRSAVVVGGGFVGLEVAENLRHRGLVVTVLERASQVLTPLDVEMAEAVHDELRAHGVGLALGAELLEITCDSLRLADGRNLPADLVVLAIGVQPDVRLARAAGLSIGTRGGIVVDDTQRTSDPRIFAVGDVAEKRDAYDSAAVLVPLANVANRAGRLVADVIAGRQVRGRPTLSTAVVKVFELTVAVTGWSERQAVAANQPHLIVHSHPSNHAGYFPDAQAMALKLLFTPDGTILGAQAVGRDGVDKRIDVIATAAHGGITAPGLADLELAYAPPYGSAKDPVNMLGYIADNLLTSTSASVQWHQLESERNSGTSIIDVRTPAEHAQQAIPGAINIELDALRDHLDDLPAGRLIVHCAIGQRGHTASTLLRALGRDVVNLDGGLKTWLAGTRATGTAPAGDAAA